MEAVTNVLTFKSSHFPTTRNCCLCLAALRGAIIFGYVNLVLALISLPLLIMTLVIARTHGENNPIPLSLDPELQLPLNIILIAVDIILTVILLIGAQKKRKELLKIYCYASLFYNVVLICMSIVYFDSTNLAQNITEAPAIVFNLYILFVVYNAIYILEEEAARAADVQYVTYRDHQGL